MWTKSIEVAKFAQMADTGESLVDLLSQDALVLIFAWVDTPTLLRAVPAVCHKWKDTMAMM